MSLSLMTMIGLVLLVGLFVGGYFVLQDIERQEQIDHRVRVIHGLHVATRRPTTDLASLRDAVMQVIATVGQTIIRTGVVSRKTAQDLEKTLAASGMRDGQGLALFVGGKLVLLVLLPLIAWAVTRNTDLSGTMRIFIPGIAAVGGLLLPDWLVNKYRTRYLARLEVGLPDALDMLVICAQAGLGLGPGIIRVATELRGAYRELAYEFALTANELQVLSDSRVALANLGLRTELDSLRRLGATLIQTIQYGTPLTDALRLLSTELRHEMLVKLETRAAKLPVLLTMPMIMFILPCVFIVAGGPAMIQVMKTLGN
ncbi:MAG: type II secretion system F family protein [Acetobacteraceae bacterium]